MTLQTAKRRKNCFVLRLQPTVPPVSPRPRWDISGPYWWPCNLIFNGAFVLRRVTLSSRALFSPTIYYHLGLNPRQDWKDEIIFQSFSSFLLFYVYIYKFRSKYSRDFEKGYCKFVLVFLELSSLIDNSFRSDHPSFSDFVNTVKSVNSLASFGYILFFFGFLSFRHDFEI